MSKRAASEQPPATPPPKKLLGKQAAAELERVTQPEAAMIVQGGTEVAGTQPTAEQKIQKAPEEKTTENASPEDAVGTVAAEQKRLSLMGVEELLADGSLMVPEAIQERAWSTMLKHSKLTGQD